MDLIPCPHCHHPHPAEARFCPATGKPLPDLKAVDAAHRGLAACPHCGQPHPAEARFCPVTGRALPEPAVTVIEAAPRPPKTPPPAESKPYRAAPRGIPWAFIIIGLLVAAAGLWGGLQLWNGVRPLLETSSIAGAQTLPDAPDRETAAARDQSASATARAERTATAHAQSTATARARDATATAQVQATASEEALAAVLRDQAAAIKADLILTATPAGWATETIGAPCLGIWQRLLDDEFVSAYGLPSDHGLYIIEIFGEPAWQADIPAGDILFRLNEQDIYTFDDLDAALAPAQVGDVVRVALQRGPREMEVEITLGRRAYPEACESE